jgi:transcriptional repressor NrdR
MNCPHCQAFETKVIETRLVQQGKVTRRRRECEVCERRFTTYESIIVQLPAIIKRDGRREPFNREKIIKGLVKACEKRNVSMTSLDELVSRVEKSLLELFKKEVSAEILGNLVMEELYKLDSVSYVRFASFYWNFGDVESFISELVKHTKHQTNTNESINEQQRPH